VADTHPEISPLHAGVDSGWWSTRADWISMNHPDVGWDAISLAYATGSNDVRRVVMFGFTDRGAAVHFALRWKGE
jgi:hypothetical protein